MIPLAAIRPLGPELQPILTAAPQMIQANTISPAELKDIAPALSEVRPPAATGSFSDLLGGLVAEVNAKQAKANADMQGLMTGQNVPLHQAMLSLEEASVSFQLMVEVRNKLLESYQELMRMQI